MITITARDNPLIKNTVKLKKSSKRRKEEGRFVAEGVRICVDAMQSCAEVETLFLTQDALDRFPEETSSLTEYAPKTVLVSDSVFSLISDTQNPQGVLCVIKTLDKSGSFDKIENGGKYIALENVQDPNNLGTVLRTAEAFGIDGVILTDDCCDVYNPKVVRGSMGAVFRLKFTHCRSICEYISANPRVKFYAAVVDSDAEKLGEFNFCEPCAAVIGNEGNGLKKETSRACSNRITIPMKGKAESLNASAAAAVIIWEMTK